MGNSSADNLIFQQEIEKLYGKYNSIMLRYAVNYVSFCDAEDIVSDCWISLLRNIAALKDKDPRIQTAYIMRTVQNALTDFFRKKQKSFAVQIKKTGCFEITSSTEETALARIFLMQMISVLSRKEQAVIKGRLNHVADKEISYVLNISPTTVRTIWHRSVIKMKENIS